jgi:hypothetical protein
MNLYILISVRALGEDTTDSDTVELKILTQASNPNAKVLLLFSP